MDNWPRLGAVDHACRVDLGRRGLALDGLYDAKRTLGFHFSRTGTARQRLDCFAGRRKLPCRAGRTRYQGQLLKR